MLARLVDADDPLANDWLAVNQLAVLEKGRKRAKVRRLLARYDYPPDKEERAVELVLEQAEALAGQVA